MEVLFDLGISDIDLKNMLEQVPSIMRMSNDEINEKIDILKYVDCNLRHIKNIIISNPYYLELLDDDILKLIKYLKEIGVSNINLLFDSNPYLLNKEDFEIKEYVDKRISDGINMDYVVDEIESNPYIIDEY